MANKNGNQPKPEENKNKNKEKEVKPQQQQQNKNTRKPNSSGNRQPENSYKTKKNGNDVAWYKRGPNGEDLFELATSISTYHMAGKKFKLTANAFTVDNDTTAEIMGPSGVVTYDMEISLGTLLNPKDGANKAAINLFNEVRGKYTSSVPFQPNDLLCYIGAVGSVIAAISDVGRILNWVNMYTQDSIIIPGALFSSRNLNFHSERNSYADNKYRLVTLINRINCITMFKDLAYFNKLRWAFSFDWYQDYSGSRGNIATFKPTGFWKWNSSVETIDDSDILASGLNFTSISSINSLSEYLDVIEDLIDALVDNDDVRTISGWLNQYVQADYIINASDYVGIEPTYPEHNELVKYQISNAKLGPTTPEGAIIAQSVTDQCLYDHSREQRFAGNIISQMNRESAMYWLDSWVLNFPSKPNHDMIMESTRFIVVPTEAKFDASINQTIVQFEYDVLYISGIKYTYFRTDIQEFYSQGVSSYLDINEGSNSYQYTGLLPYFRTLQLLRLIDCYPSVVLTYREVEYQAAEHVQLLVDSDYAFEIQHEDISKLHSTALLSEFFLSLSSYRK